MSHIDLILPVLCLALCLYLMTKVRVIVYDLVDDIGDAPHWSKLLIRCTGLLIALSAACVLGVAILLISLSIIATLYA